MYPILVSSLSAVKDLKYVKFSLKTYLSKNFKNMPSNYRIEVLRVILKFYNIKIDYTSNEIQFQFMEGGNHNQIISDLISADVTAEEFSLNTKKA